MQFNKGADYELEFPISSVPANTDLASPVIGFPHTDEPEFDIEEQAKLVVEVTEDVKNGVYPHDFLKAYFKGDCYPEELPIALQEQGLSIDDPLACANIVHMDNPIDLGKALLDWALRDGATTKCRDTGSKDFLNAVPQVMARLATEIDIYLRRAFETKYFYGVPRPEEVIGFNFTVYPEGSPNHPSYVAGHGTVAGVTYRVLNEMLVLDECQTKEIYNSCYLWSQFRTFAGVHYPEDNIAGLNLGARGGF